jgi:hypothetical protein
MPRTNRNQPLSSTWRGLNRQTARALTHPHQALHTEKQRQGRALHPDLPERMGLRTGLQSLSTENRGAADLAAPIQLAQAAYPESALKLQSAGSVLPRTTCRDSTSRAGIFTRKAGRYRAVWEEAAGNSAVLHPKWYCCRQKNVGHMACLASHAVERHDQGFDAVAVSRCRDHRSLIADCHGRLARPPRPPAPRREAGRLRPALPRTSRRRSGQARINGIDFVEELDNRERLFRRVDQMRSIVGRLLPACGGSGKEACMATHDDRHIDMPGMARKSRSTLTRALATKAAAEIKPGT